MEQAQTQQRRARRYMKSLQSSSMATASIRTMAKLEKIFNKLTSWMSGIYGNFKSNKRQRTQKITITKEAVYKGWHWVWERMHRRFVDFRKGGGKVI